MTTTAEQTRVLADEHRWRLQTARALVALEEEAFGARLPVLDWKVSARTLIGHPPHATPDTSAQAAVEAWHAHLDGTWQDSYEPIRGETRRVHFTATRTVDHADVTIRVYADLAIEETP